MQHSCEYFCDSRPAAESNHADSCEDLTGTVIPLEVNSSDTVQSVKRQLHSIEGNWLQINA